MIGNYKHPAPPGLLNLPLTAYCHLLTAICLLLFSQRDGLFGPELELPVLVLFGAGQHLAAGDS